MRSKSVFTVGALIAGGFSSLLVARPAAADGKQAFLDAKCNKCHTVNALKIEKLVVSEAGDDEDKDDKGAKPVDLSGVGLKQGVSAEWLAKWLNKEVKQDSVVKPGKEVTHKKKFKGTPEQLQEITAFLLSLKTK